MYRGSSLVQFEPQTGFPGPAASSPKASNPLPDKPSQEAAGEREKENGENGAGNSGHDPGVAAGPSEDLQGGGLLRGSREIGGNPTFQSSDRHLPQHQPGPSPGKVLWRLKSKQS